MSSFAAARPRVGPIPKSPLDVPVHALVKLFATGILMFSGLVDMPRAIEIGSVTSQAYLTVGYYCVAAVLLIMTPVADARVPWRMLPFAGFLLWAMTSLLWSPARANGVQNILAAGAFPLLVFLGEGTASVVPSFGFWLEKWFLRSIFLATCIYAISVMVAREIIPLSARAALDYSRSSVSQST